MYYLERGEDGKGDVFFPTQIIVTGELDKAKHSTLRVLTNNADEADIRLFLEEALSEDGKEDRNNVDAVLQVSVSANAELYERIRRDDRMCQALRELMKDEIREELDKAERQGGISCAVAIYRDELGMDDQTIISRIIPRFNLTREQAKAYVIPQGM